MIKSHSLPLVLAVVSTLAVPAVCRGQYGFGYMGVNSGLMKMLSSGQFGRNMY